MADLPRDDTRRANIGIYENLMEDAAMLADIFIGNQIEEEFDEGGEYVPFLQLLADFHFNPENRRLYSELKHKINFIKKSVQDLSTQIDSNHRKASHLYHKGRSIK